MIILALLFLGNLCGCTIPIEDELTTLRSKLHGRPCCLEFDNNLNLEWWERLVAPLLGTEIALDIVRNGMFYDFDPNDEN